MTNKKRYLGMGDATVTAMVLVPLAAVAIWFGLSHTAAADERDGEGSSGEEVAYVGRIMDAYGFMTGKYASSDRAKCTADCIRSGVPALLVMEDGPVLLGQGPSGAARVLMAHAYKEVVVRGMLFEKDGISYVDVRSISLPEADEPMEDELTGSEDDEDED